jgi:hypothetical protein
MRRAAVGGSRKARAARRRKRLDERAFLLRHLEINAALDLRFQRPDPQ